MFFRVLILTDSSDNGEYALVKVEADNYEHAYQVALRQAHLKSRSAGGLVFHSELMQLIAEVDGAHSYYQD